MPFEVELGRVVGLAAEDAAPGAQLKVEVQGFSSSEDGEEFIQRLEGVGALILGKVGRQVNPSTIDHLVAVVRPDGMASVYINECNVLVSARMGRPVEKGEAIFVRDFIDIAALKFDGVDFPADAGVICVFSAAWRKALFFDLAPLGEERIPRDYDISKTLGSLMAYLHSQGVFKMTPDDWEYMIGNQWFPFVTLNPDLRLKLVRSREGAEISMSSLRRRRLLSPRPCRRCLRDGEHRTFSSHTSD
jgi:hypothetical protein